MIRATVTFSYDGRNSKARWFLDLLFSTGLFTQKDSKPNKRTMAAIKEAQTGEYAGEVDVSSMDAMMSSMK